MAAWLLLLLALISNSIHAEVLLPPGGSHQFVLNETADYCSVSRWTGAEKKLLWNSTVQASYEIERLDISHSGQYQEQCWTQGYMTHERNSTLLVCDDQQMTTKVSYFNVRETMEMTCDSVGPNQSVQWAFEKFGTRGLSIIEDGASPKYQLVENRSSLLVIGENPNDEYVYYCLEKNHHGCRLLGRVYYYMLPDIILRLEGESLGLNCSSFWKVDRNMSDNKETKNYMTRNDGGKYSCEASQESYFVLVCPESKPTAHVRLTAGENVTLKCNDSEFDPKFMWLVKTGRTGGRLLSHLALKIEGIYVSGMDLVIENVSQQDIGEVWCAEMRPHCVFSAKTVLEFREPEVDPF